MIKTLLDLQFYKQCGSFYFYALQPNTHNHMQDRHVCGGLEYADELTLGRALEGRREIEG
jgi:hypothetical protein